MQAKYSKKTQLSWFWSVRCLEVVVIMIRIALLVDRLLVLSNILQC